VLVAFEKTFTGFCVLVVVLIFTIPVTAADGIVAGSLHCCCFCWRGAATGDDTGVGAQTAGETPAIVCRPIGGEDSGDAIGDIPGEIV